MTKSERDELRDLVIEIGNDVKWMKSQREEDNRWFRNSLNDISNHFSILNNNVARNTANIKWLRWLTGAITLAILGFAIKVFLG